MFGHRLIKDIYAVRPEASIEVVFLIAPLSL